VQTELLRPRLADAPTVLDRVRARRVPAAPIAGAIAAGAWLVLAPRTPDLASQVYRLYLFDHGGFVLWDNSWYAGHHIPGYSLLYPPLAWLLGIRLLGVLAVLVSATIFERLALQRYGPRALAGTVFFALAAAGDLWIGRVAFALGVSFAMAAVLVLAWPGRRRGMVALAVVCAALCAASSPVAGLMLGLAALTYAAAQRRLVPAVALLGPVVVVVGLLQALFPEGGYEPFPASSLAAALAVTLAFLWALPTQERLLRLGGLLYLVVELACLIHTPMGSNVERYGVLLSGPLLLCALSSRGGLGAGPRPAWAAGCVLGAIGVWVAWGPIVQNLRVAGDLSTRAAYYLPVERFFAQHGGSTLRVEVPFTRSHWEAALLAPHVALAGGWDKQLGKRYAAVLGGRRLTPAAYERWLDQNAVSYVALADVPLDGSSAREAALVRSGMPFLREVFSEGGWRVYRVLGARPIVEGPGRLTTLGHDSFTLLARAAGSFLVRVHYTPWWTVTNGGARVAAAPGGWTALRVSRPGRVTVSARFSLTKALELL
jgi:hypothetical protein